MKVPRWAWVTLLTASAAMMLWTLGQAPAAPPPPAPPAPTVVAKGPVVVVDVEEVVENYNRAKDVRKELETRRAQVDAEMQKRKDAITAIETMLKSGQLTEGSAEYNKQVNEQARLAFQMEGDQKYMMGMLLIDRHRLLRSIYDDVNAAVAAVAKERKYTIVLQTNHKMPRTGSMEELRQMIQDRKVLYGDPSEDITEMVLKHLNDAGRAAGTRPAP